MVAVTPSQFAPGRLPDSLKSCRETNFPDTEPTFTFAFFSLASASRILQQLFWNFSISHRLTGKRLICRDGDVEVDLRRMLYS